ncbi:sensor histidine kinase [Streptantibioticus parmotrematis]|uniref:sensor histidine kinase n=1 Tax=Streptantibioticus parmotrematis TaxID=2873249 RepID=UPI00207BF296|nr:nitrate- and nitrite sensing domain-containing protein [Streptantibioticus parmotrematis]
MSGPAVAEHPGPAPAPGAAEGTAAQGGPTGPSRRGRSRRRVRSRLIGALLVSLLAVVAASAPGLAAATGDLTQSGRLLKLTQLNTSAIALSHALADERDDMAAYVAAGRTTASGHGVSEDERAGVDRQAQQVEQAAAALDTGGSPDLARTTATVRQELAALPRVRQSGLSGTGSARDAFDAYTPVVSALDAVSGALARALPSRAADPDTSAGPALATVVQQASAEHGLLVAALTAGGASSELVAEAQQARVAEQAAYAQFDATASPTARTQYTQTVTGTDVTTAEDYLRQLTDAPYLSAADNRLKTSDVDAALAARIDRMRAVQSSLAAADTTRLTSLHADDMTALELRAALVALCVLLVVAAGVQSSRSVVRPLARLRRYASAPAGPPPVGSRDEIADVARDVERLTQDAVLLREQAAEQARERERLIAVRARTAAEHEEMRRGHAALAAQHAELLAERDELLSRAQRHQGTAHGTFVNLSLRSLSLVERQLALIEGLENREQDPDELETLFKLDHLATRMRRNGESLLVLAGAENTGGAMAKPVPLIDVVRAGISEIERYERVRIPFLPRTQLVGFAADDVSHLVAELMENATAFSPPQADVQVSGWLLENGEIMLSVEDQGIGVPPDRLGDLNRLLADPDPDESDAPAGLGLYVVARLAARHGVRVQLREQKQGGVAAVVVVPRSLVVGSADPDAPVPDLIMPDVTPAVGTQDPAPAASAAPGHPTIPAQAPRTEAPQARWTEAPQAPAPTIQAPQAPAPAPQPQAPARPVVSGPPAPSAGDRIGPPTVAGTPVAGTPLSTTPAAGTPLSTTPAAGTPAAGTPVAAAHAAHVVDEHARPPGGAAPAGREPARPRHGRHAAPRPDVPPVDSLPVADAPPTQGPGTAGQADAGASVVGLPKRVPRASGLTGEPPARQRVRPVDADALRRRLGGFAQGLRDGRRDAEAEATGTVELPLPGPMPGPVPGPRTTGDRSDSEPSEEARG